MRSRKIPRLLVLCCVLLAVSLAVPMLSGCDTAAKVYKLGISQIVTHPALDDARQGVIDGMTEAGYIEGEDVEYDYQCSEGDMSLVASIAQKFVTDKVDAIVSIATPDSQASVNAAKGTDIPVIFSAITDPVGAGLVVEWASHPDENVTGVSDMISVADDVELIQQIVPGIQTMGTIYSSGEDNSVFLNGKLIEACDATGIEVIEETVSTSTDILAAVNALVGKVDAIWIGTDNTVVSGLEAVIGVCENNQIPLFASDDPSIERGCIAAWGFDYYDIGVQTGKMLAEVLEADGDASGIAVEKGEIIFLSVSTAAADRMGVTIPQDLLDIAVTIYDE